VQPKICSDSVRH